MSGSEPLFSVPETAEDIVSMIMSMHWDMASCECWICAAGRLAGVRNRAEYVRQWRREGFEYVGGLDQNLGRRTFEDTSDD